MLSLLLFVISGGIGEAAKRVKVEGIRNSTSEKYARIVVDLDGHVNYTQSRLSNPDRIYFDLKDCFLPETITMPLHNGILTKIRAAQFNNETVRIVLDLQEIEDVNVFILNEPYRLVIDVFGKEVTAPVIRDDKREGLIAGIKKVVIDPGHGGEDPGAIGPSGLKEKDVVLDIAKKLGRILNEKYGMEIIYTRDKDIFIPLEERTAVANLNNADLFISVHANASRTRKAKGIETYFLNWTTDEGANRVAARENAISYKRMQEAQSELQIILQDLARTNKSEESKWLAHNVQTSLIDTMSKSYNDIVDLEVKWALFYVLVGAKMPSILIETSFISNREEEKRLSDRKYRENLAEAIASGINKYVDSKIKVVKRVASGNI